MLARVDPELTQFFRRQPDLNHSPDPLVARKQFARAFKLSKALRPGYVTDRVTVEDMSFSAYDDGREIAIRRYLPQGLPEAAPVLVYFHGALLAGDLDTEHDRCLRYADEVGCAVVSVDYRRPPEHPFPEPVEDAYAAIRWVADTAADWGGDPSRIAVGGSSSGATLAAAVAIVARDRGGPDLVLQVLLYPALDDREITPSIEAYSITPAGTPLESRWLWQFYVGDDPAVAASPHAVPSRCTDFAGLAPVYLLVADVDPLRDEALQYAVGMMRAGVRVELHLIAGTCHGFDAVAPESAVAQRSIREQSDALRWAFANPPNRR